MVRMAIFCSECAKNLVGVGPVPVSPSYNFYVELYVARCHNRSDVTSMNSVYRFLSRLQFYNWNHGGGATKSALVSAYFVTAFYKRSLRDEL
jgi:hypothetical protein